MGADKRRIYDYDGQRFKVWRNANLVLHVAERGKPKGNVEFPWLLHSRILTRVKRHLRCDRLKL